MKYITEVALKNFQSHKNTVLKLDSKLNIIVGPSDSGKTSILRGIKWVLYNEPLGDYFMRDGEDSCSVTISLNNGVKVERYRDKSKNQYNIYFDGEKETFEGFGSGVPLEVTEAVGIDKLELDQKESRSINLAEQLEGPFLISEKPSVKASSIGRLVGANIIDDALKESLKDNRNLNIKLNTLLADNLSLEEELETYKYLEDLEEANNKLEKILAKIKVEQVKKARLEELYFARLENIKLINLNKKILRDLIKLQKLEDRIRNLDLLIYKYDNLRRLSHKKIDNSQRIDKEKKVLDRTLNIIKVEEALDSLTSKLDYIIKIKKKNEESIILKNNKSKLGEITLKFEKIDQVDYEKITTKINQYRRAREISLKYRDTKVSLVNGKKFIGKFDDLHKVEKSTERLVQLLGKREKIEKVKDKYLANFAGLKKGGSYVADKKTYIKSLLVDYGKLLEEAETCPLCFSKLSDEHIKNIMKNYLEEDYEL